MDWPCPGGHESHMSRNKKAAERGGSKANLILTLLVLGIMGFVAIKICPVYFANYEFQDSIESESRFALTGYPKKTPDDVRNDVWNKAKDLGIPTQKDAIKIAMDTGSVEIGVEYSVPIDLAVYQFTLQFHPHADNHTI
jgi:hypothetical protein